MENFLAQAQNCKPGELKQLIRTHHDRVREWARHGSLANVIPSISAEHNSALLSYLLYNGANENQERLGCAAHLDVNIANIQHLFRNFKAADVVNCWEFYELAAQFATFTCVFGNSQLAILPLKLAIEKMNRQVPHVLTPLHESYLKVCLRANHYSVALPVIDTPILEVMKGVTSLQTVAYFFYAGTIYCGLKKWDKAKRMFNLCLSIPAVTPSQVQIDAWKKLVLVELLTRGVLPSAPPHAAHCISRSCRSNNLPYPYADIAKAFSAETFQNTSNSSGGGGAAFSSPQDDGGNPENSISIGGDGDGGGTGSAAAASGASGSASGGGASGSSSLSLEVLLSESRVMRVLQDDGNLGLAKNLAKTVRSRRVHMLTSTYLSLSLTSIGRKARAGADPSDSAMADAENLDDAAAGLILEMVQKGELSARMDRANGTVHFGDVDAKWGGEIEAAQTAKELEDVTRRVRALADRIRDMDNEMVGSEAFQKQLEGFGGPAGGLRMGGLRGGPGGLGAGALGMGMFMDGPGGMMG
uniref:COP9 signalosome complex subunit 3 n=1 Tax=Chromera velia CCMP2878 TaxID=1169474 RepID=A0A0G4G0K9_9ALVE|eukprot:Cvel_19655.t1-p1 / transcript=Cvel_19655.t1 / gene=Cvel_19655 / organism=Chromera_velia_CCMP2878 / gene_product=COP9 signalosome complex subunit 3, putative / transcript_product=COP9 signalosome complex subunit 3, putative / location=Cvel_scaffold1713:15049-19367(-) / protein_length=527 / sequence_SO=supercontig / SO=protein_coding / is_pseudo=false